MGNAFGQRVHISRGSLCIRDSIASAPHTAIFQDVTMEREEYTSSEHHTETKDVEVLAHDREVTAEPKGDAVFGVQGTGDVHYTVMGW